MPLPSLRLPPHSLFGYALITTLLGLALIGVLAFALMLANLATTHLFVAPTSLRSLGNVLVVILVAYGFLRLVNAAYEALLRSHPLKD